MKFFKKFYTVAVLFSIVFFYAINNYIWLKKHQLPPQADEAYHLLRGLDYFDILTHFSKGMFSALVKVDNLRPPFFHICMAIANVLWGNSRVVSIMTNIFFAGVLFFSIFYIGQKIQNKRTGLLAAFILAMYPFVFGLSRMSLPTFASMALFSLSLCCLIYSNKFRLPFPSVLLGLFIGLGVLTDLTFILFIIGPLVAEVITALIEKNTAYERKKIILNLVLTFILAVLVGGSWYFPRFAFLLKTYWRYGYYIELPFLPDVFSFSSLIFYLRSLVNGQLTPFFVLFFFISLVKILKDQDKIINYLFFPCILVTYAIFTLIRTKEFSDTSVYLPAFALITAIGILRLKKRWLRRCFISLIVFGGLFQYFVISFTTPSSTGVKLCSFNGKFPYGIITPAYIYPISEVFFHYPRRGDWKINAVISAIKMECADNKDVTIGVTDAYVEVKTDWYDPLNIGLFYHENFITANVDALEYSLRTHGLKYNIISLSYWLENWKEEALLNFIISVRKIDELAPLISQQYKIILQTEVPDGSPLYVYKRKV